MKCPGYVLARLHKFRLIRFCDVFDDHGGGVHAPSLSYPRDHPGNGSRLLRAAAVCRQPDQQLSEMCFDGALAHGCMHQLRLKFIVDSHDVVSPRDIVCNEL